MKRRDFLASTGGLAAWLATGLPRPALAGPADDGPLVYVGTYTDEKRTDGIFAFRMDPRTGAWRPLGAIAAGPSPSFLALHPNGRVLYAANEVEQYEGAASGAVSAFALDPAAGGLTLLGRRASGGGAPCYASVDRAGRFALVANYVGGSVALFPLGPNGALGEAARIEPHAGSGPRRDRQERPHAHSILPDPSGRFALSADLGTDQVLVYALEGPAGPLSPAAVPAVALRPGAGPRHLAFHRGGRFVSVVAELDATISTFRFDPATGALALVQTLPLLGEPRAGGAGAGGAGAGGAGAGEHFAADVHVAPSGRFLYASVRGDDVLCVFAVDQATGALTPVERVSTGGHWPRNFGLDPSGRFLYAANQRSDSVIGFRVDPASGRLTPSGMRVEVPMPACVLFAPGA